MLDCPNIPKFEQEEGDRSKIWETRFNLILYFQSTLFGVIKVLFVWQLLLFLIEKFERFHFVSVMFLRLGS